MAQRNVAIQRADSWCVHPRYEDIKGIGKTLEWFVGEWFRFTQAPARHSVRIPEIVDGGDLDVVAFLNGQKIFVECKSGNPANISETHLKLFLRRAVDFNPTIALLLIDTESKIDKQIDMLKKVYAETELITPQSFQLERWDSGCVHVQNTHKGIANALYSALRSHSSNTNEDRPLIGLSISAPMNSDAFATDEERNKWLCETATEFARSRGLSSTVMIVRPYWGQDGEQVLTVYLNGEKTPRLQTRLSTFTNMSRKDVEYWLHGHLYKV